MFFEFLYKSFLYVSNLNEYMFIRIKKSVKVYLYERSVSSIYLYGRFFLYYQVKNEYENQIVGNLSYVFY